EGMRSLAGAWPDPSVFQVVDSADIIARLLGEKGGQLLQYGSTRGQYELREELAALTSEKEKRVCSPDQILITSGSAQGLDLACRIFIDPGDIVLVGLPSYFGATAAISSHGGINVGIPVDESGIDVEAMEIRLLELQRSGQVVKAVYVIPNFQNPAGVTLSLSRRTRLIELAERFDFLIFEDDPYGELRFEGEHLPSLLGLDEAGRVLHFHSASKIFSPGMRVAWAVGQTTVVDKLERSKQTSDISTNTLSQMVLLEFIRSGQLQGGIKQNCAHYRLKRDLMLGLLDEHFPREVSWTHPAGGFFTFVTLPPHMDSDELLVEALENRIAYVSGPAFFVDGSGTHRFRLSYSQASTDDISSAVPELAGLIAKRL
ncbi:MAG: PLP-dependent aminotransferase family protein, partial [Desulfofustis sp.]